MTAPQLSRRHLLLASVAASLATTTGGAAWALGERPWLGVELARSDVGGASCKRVFKKSPADKAGLVDGDRIVAVDGVEITAPGEIVRLVADTGVGKTLKLSVVHRDDKRTVQVLLVAHPGDEEVARMHQLGSFAPSWKGVHQVRGEVGDVKQLKGRVVLLSFWASWCGACRAMIPVLNDLSARHGVEGLSVVGLTDEPEAVALRAADKHDMRYALGAETSSETMGDYLVRALPTYYLIDKKGVMREVFFGMQEKSTLEKSIVKLLKDAVL